MDKYEELLETLGKYEKLCVAYSGGADSTLLLKAAIEALPKGKVVAIIADTVFFSRAEISDAKEIAEKLGAKCYVICIDVLHSPQLANNEANRCYHCKSMIFADIAKAALSFGIKTIADGKIREESETYHHGEAAAAELGVVSPLYDCGIYKNDVREISERLGLPTWNKPTNSCLVTRFPHDTEITVEKLKTIEKGEDYLSSLGVGALRLRTHDDIARIEVGKEDFEKLLGTPELVNHIKSLGYRYVTLDLEGFRTGSMDVE